ncbi:Conjugal transfer protein TrbJ [Cupriavidus necator]|uniref:Conjugal transfer protein TrbJ n=1 Tax=Cupriavidus necator TaxID=106590 RepID=A0A1K0IW43_CUPNE|nr:Conjugal transfer protein TrbJ [Cupriavidus necator]
MKKAFAGVLASATLLTSTLAHASGWPVFDAANFVKNTMTAAQALKTEIYENTNIVYQNRMMLNQLQQAVGLDAVSMAAQAKGIGEDIDKYQRYGQSLKDLYGSVADTADFLTNVQGLVAASGKSPDQWFRDQRKLLDTGDKTAKRLFGLGQAVTGNNQKLAKRRRDLQSDLDLNQTAQATAQLTNQMLDVMAGQNADLLQLIGAKTQADAVKDQRENADTAEKMAASEQLARQQADELQQLRRQVFNRGTLVGK